MSQIKRIVGREGVVINGRRYNSTFLQEYLYQVGTVEQIDNTTIAVNFDGITVLAESQNATELNTLLNQEG